MKYKWIAYEGLEYDIFNGWEWSERVLCSELYNDYESCVNSKQEFIDSLNLHETTVVKIEIEHLYYDKELEKYDAIDWSDLDIIDNSREYYSNAYMLLQYYGQYMIPSEKYKIDSITASMTLNEATTRIENSSYKWHIMSLFNTLEEAQEYCKDNCLYLNDY